MNRPRPIWLLLALASFPLLCVWFGSRAYTAAHAQEPKATVAELDHPIAFRYPCKIVRVIDGDTVVLDVALGLNVCLCGESTRLYGVNCPERGTLEGEAAKVYTVRWFEKNAGPYSFTPIGKSGREKFGRLLGTIRAASGANLNEQLLEDGHATKYPK